MIYYTTGFMNIFKTKGSVFPMSTRAALPCAIFSAILRWAINEGYCAFMEADDSIMSQTQAWAGFSVLVGFLIIFRSSQAYSRFWDGCTATHHMRADWFDMASALISFTETSKAPAEKVAKFKHIIIRLVSMMHSCALMDLEEMNNKWGTTSDVKADQYDLLDPLGLDKESLDALYESKERVMLIFQWIQLMIVRNMEAGVLAVPPPILSRAYQELANGMVAFHECVKISDTPFPFPYAQNCELLLFLHWVLVPLVVSQWVTQPFWAFVFVFMQVFVLWSLNYLAEEIENPFGTDDNAIDGAHMQEEMNRNLLLLLHPRTMRAPEISDNAVFSVSVEALDWDVQHKTFKDIWSNKKRQRERPTCSLTPYRDFHLSRSSKSSEEDHKDQVAANDRLRIEAQTPPDEPGVRPAPLMGLKGSWAIPLEEGRGPPTLDKSNFEALPKKNHHTSRSPRGINGINGGSGINGHGLLTPSMDKNRLSALQGKAQPTSRSPRRGEDTDSASSSSDRGSNESDRTGSCSRGRSGSRKRQNQRGRQTRL